jgi:predicted amidohydrolase
VGLIQTMRGIRRREEISWNLDHISHMVKAASWLSSMDLPVRLICIPEGGLQGFTDEVFDLDHETYARECEIDIPGPETDALGALARQWNAYVIAQAKARHPEFPGRFFNVGSVIEPEDGTVISVQNRARALDNNMYVIGMNLGTYLPDKDSTTPIDTFSGGSQIVDYRGQIVTEVPYGAGSTWIAGTLERAPYTHAEYRHNVTQAQVELLQERGVWLRSGRAAAVD